MALTNNTPLVQEIGDRNECVVAAGRRIYEGSMVFENAAGRATDVQGGAGARFLGHAFAEANNTAGGEGAIRVNLRTGRYRAQVTIAGVALTDIGAQVFASDNDAFALTSNGGANSMVGRVVRFVAANTAVVEFAAAPPDLVMVVQQAHIADAKINYGAGDLDLEAEIIAAINATNTSINAILTALEAAGVLAVV